MKAKLVSGTHSRTENGSRVRYTAGDVIKNLTKKEYKDFKFKFKIIKEGKKEISNKAIEKKVEKYYAGNGWYDIPGAKKKLHKKEAIEVLKEG